MKLPANVCFNCGGIIVIGRYGFSRSLCAECEWSMKDEERANDADANENEKEDATKNKSAS